MSNNLELFVRQYVDELQALDAAATELLSETSLESAVGVQLDGLGQIIGLERQGLSDDDYRSLLRAYVVVNDGGGSIEQINEIVRLASNTTVADNAFVFAEGATAEFVVTFPDQLPPGDGLIVAEAVYQGKAAGVHGVTSYAEALVVFAFDGAVSAKFDGASGFRTAIRNRNARESETS